MSFNKYLKLNRKSKESQELQKSRLISWRREPVIIRIQNPTKLDRARILGYKAKQGIVIARIKLLRRSRKRPLFKAGRRSKHLRRRKVLNLNYQTIAERRVNKKFPNLEVLNSYLAGKDGKNYWYEVILADPSLSLIKKDKNLNWLSRNKKRAFRGLTSASKKSRGLRKKGRGAEKVR